MKKEMLLIDGHGLAFRGFYALPETLTASDGTPTNAVVGFTNMLLKGLNEWNVDALGLFFDPKGPTRRHEMFKEYKEGRRPTPEGFKTQLPLIVDISRAMGLPVFIRDGVEADDYIVSTARWAALEGWNVRILSADKDLFQIIDKNIRVIRPTKGVSDFRLYDEEFFRAEFGFEPSSMADYLALLGDAADNIPGVPGIGEKSAKELISLYGTLEGIYGNLDGMTKGRRAKLEENKGLAYMSRELVVPQITEPVPTDMLFIGQPDMPVLTEICARLGLKKLLAHFAGAKRQNGPKRDGHEEIGLNTGKIEYTRHAEPVEADFALLLGSGELALAESELADGRFYLCDRDNRTSLLNIHDAADLALWSEWCGRGTLFLYGCRRLAALYDLPLPPLERINDVESAHYLLHPDRGGRSIEKTIGRELKIGLELVSELFPLWDAFNPELEKYGLTKLMRELDMPLCLALAGLQRAGLHADASMLESLGVELERAIAKTEEEIANIVGERINLNSPKQVGWLLFEHLKLPPLKKTQSGYSTDMSVLEELARLPEPMCDVPAMIINYREQAKILSGFVLPFHKLTLSGDGFIHSTFDHLATGTGRLASYDPNVQNMPVFGEWAVKFRSCFVPSSPDRTFVAADYSQIELRVLAHLSGERRLIEAFSEGRDVHMETASWVFGLPPEDITQEQRRFAKVVNFGLLYGMSAHGLAQRLGISRPQAASMVKRYFDVLPRVQKYLDSSVREAKDAGYTKSIFGRIRPLREVATVEGRGNNPIDRVALNTPIQSAASDIAKIALLRFCKAAAEEFKDARVVLQIHDSIVCECAKKDADAVEKRLVEVMEGVNVLSVPVKAEPKRGDSLSKV